MIKIYGLFFLLLVIKMLSSPAGKRGKQAVEQQKI